MKERGGIEPLEFGVAQFVDPFISASTFFQLIHHLFPFPTPASSGFFSASSLWLILTADVSVLIYDAVCAENRVCYMQMPLCNHAIDVQEFKFSF